MFIEASRYFQDDIFAELSEAELGIDSSPSQNLLCKLFEIKEEVPGETIARY